jgi:hypothetical protein
MKKIILFLFLNTFFINALWSQNDFGKFNNGDIICSDNGQFIDANFRVSTKPYDELVVGVYKKTESENITDNKSFYRLPITRDGILLVKFNSENGPIKKGDLITSSSTPGEGMKATQSGMIIGVALEDASAASGLIKIRVLIQYVKQ